MYQPTPTRFAEELHSSLTTAFGSPRQVPWETYGLALAGHRLDGQLHEATPIYCNVAMRALAEILDAFDDEGDDVYEIALQHIQNGIRQRARELVEPYPLKAIILIETFLHEMH
jgi:hypothetical protein